MTDEHPNPAETDATPDVPAETPEGEAIENPTAYAASQEAKRYRLQLRETERELERLRKAEEERLQAEALKRGEHEQVIADLKPKAERVAELEAALQAYLDTELESIPDQYHGLIPGGDAAAKLAWIAQAKNSGVFGVQGKPPAPNLNATEGVAPGGKRPPKLSDAQRAMARAFGMSEEDYAKYLSDK